MSRRYRISRPQNSLILLRNVGIVLASVALLGTVGVLTGVSAITAAGTALLIGGPAAMVRRHLRAGNVLVLLPNLVAVDRWSLPWSAVSEVVVFAHTGSTTLLGVRLRWPQDVPADVPTSQLDRTTPNRPVILSSVASNRVDLHRLAAVLDRINPTGVKLVHHNGKSAIR